MQYKQKIQSVKSAIYKYSLGVLGLGAVCFVFEACYGTPPVEFDLRKEIQLKGLVKSSETNLPLKGINVSIFTHEGRGMTNTNENGEFSVNMNLSQGEQFEILLQDTDNEENGVFLDKAVSCIQGELEINKKITAFYLEQK